MPFSSRRMSSSCRGSRRGAVTAPLYGAPTKQTLLRLYALSGHALEQLRQIPDFLVRRSGAILDIRAAVLEGDGAFKEIDASIAQTGDELLHGGFVIGAQGFAERKANRACVW